jgi:hypothetical protein
MSGRSAFLLLSALLLTSCQTDGQMLDSEQDMATQAALRRGRFEMNCPAATGTILSREMLQPAYWRGFERAEYTIGLEGCGQRSTYVVVCPASGDSCFAAGSAANRAGR